MSEETKHDDSTMEEVEEDVTPDGGVKKKILQKGTGYLTPEKGSEVKVHYVGRLLDGTVFDSSRDRDQPFTFFLGKGNVIKGWDESVKDMKKGEKALVTIKPEYGYGAAGSPPKIPANSTLQFEIELLSWNSEEDLTKDGGVLKKILKEGEGWAKPKEDEAVTVNYVIKRLVNDQPSDEVIVEKTGFSFVVGSDEQVVPAIDKAVKEMKKGEKCFLKVKSTYAYGADGNSTLGIKPNEDLYYEIELIDWQKEKGSWEMSTAEKMEALIKKKEEGNELFKKGKFDGAIKKYTKALDYVQSDYSFSDEEKAKAKQLKLPCLLNNAMCMLKQKRWKEAIEQSTKALEIDHNNVKGIFRKAKGEIGLDKWEEAMKDLNRCKELDPSNKEVLAEISALKQTIAKHNKKESAIFKNMFQRLSQLEEEENKEKEKSQASQGTKGEEKSETAETKKEESKDTPMEESKDTLTEEKKVTSTEGVSVEAASS